MPEITEVCKRLRNGEIDSESPLGSIVAVMRSDLAALLDDHERLQAAFPKAKERMEALKTERLALAHKMLERTPPDSSLWPDIEAAWTKDLNIALAIIREEFGIEGDRN